MKYIYEGELRSRHGKLVLLADRKATDLDDLILRAAEFNEHVRITIERLEEAGEHEADNE